MSMPATVRHQEILRHLRDAGGVRSAELAKELGVTPMTVWRDLAALVEQGLARRVRGGVAAVTVTGGEPDFEAKVKSAGAAKARIADCAARLFVRAGDVLALEGGTTVAALADALPHDHISVVTNSLPVALRLRAARPRVPVTLPGGWMSPVSGNLCGPDAVRRLGRVKSTVCFISATGYVAGRGPMDPNPLEIEAKRALAAGARRVVLLLDAAKFGRASSSVTLHPARLHAVVTDAPPPAGIAAELRRHGVRLVVA